MTLPSWLINVFNLKLSSVYYFEIVLVTCMVKIKTNPSGNIVYKTDFVCKCFTRYVLK